jgi:hypothetical protein
MLSCASVFPGLCCLVWETLTVFLRHSPHSTTCDACLWQEHRTKYLVLSVRATVHSRETERSAKASKCCSSGNNCEKRPRWSETKIWFALAPQTYLRSLVRTLAETLTCRTFFSRCFLSHSRQMSG